MAIQTPFTTFSGQSIMVDVDQLALHQQKKDLLAKMDNLDKLIDRAYGSDKTSKLQALQAYASQAMKINSKIRKTFTIIA
jgi:hypothetical protein